MILDLREFDEFPAETSLLADPGEISPFGDSVIGVEKVECDLAIQKSSEEFFCQGRVRAELTLECARCLTHFRSRVEGETDFIATSEATVQERKNVIDDEDYVFFKGDDLRVDVTEPVRHTLGVELPLKPLCSDECKGLCQQCGANLNKKTCNCRSEDADPRWEGLKKLLPDQ